VPEEVDCGARDDDRHFAHGQPVSRVGDHELVPDGADDHPGDHHDVQVRVAVAREPRPVGGELEPALRDASHVVEVQPPHRRGRQEGEPEREQPRRVEIQL
jgi:hypothetical protein